MAAVLKTADVQASVGSNPTLSVTTNTIYFLKIVIILISNNTIQNEWILTP